MREDHFLLAVSSQSDEGDFEGAKSKGNPADWVFTLDEDLEIVEKRKRKADHNGTCIGFKDGAPVYRDDAVFRDLDAGSPEALIDYGDWYLIVSTNITGIDPNVPPDVSAVYYQKETVYSGYDKKGKMMFRAVGG